MKPEARKTILLAKLSGLAMARTQLTNASKNLREELAFVTKEIELDKKAKAKTPKVLKVPKAKAKK